MSRQKIIITSTLALAAFVCSALSLDYANASTLTPEEGAVDDAVTLLKGVYQSEVDAYNSEYPDAQLHLVFEQGGGLYKPDGINAAISLNGLGEDEPYGYEVKTADDIVSGIDETTAIAPLTSAGFLPYYPYDYFYYPLTRQYLNSDTGVLCAFNAASFSCGHISWYSITDEWKALLNGIGSAYYAKEGVYPFVVGDSGDNSTIPVIYDSEYSPYQYIFINSTDYAISFYRQSPTSDWVFFNKTQAPGDCSEYTGEAQKGFAGYICYDGGVESKVAVPASTDDESASDGDSGVKTPDTGLFTNTNSGSNVANTFAIIALIASGAGIAFAVTRRLIKRNKIRNF